MNYDLSNDEKARLRLAFRRALGNALRAYFLTTTQPLKCKKGDSEIGEVLDDHRFRSAIVFQHAAIEDLLREIGRVVLPNCPNALEQISFAGENPNEKPNQRGEKISLKRFAVTFKGLISEEIVRRSVNEHLNAKTFNSIEDIVVYLKQFLVDEKPLEGLELPLSTLIKRRHLIVHRADCIDEGLSSPKLAEEDKANLTKLLGETSGIFPRLLKLVLGETWKQALPDVFGAQNFNVVSAAKFIKGGQL